MDWIEIVGFITGLACVYLNTKENVWGWPIAMLSVVFYGIVFFNAKLYADAGLQAFFFVLCTYGLVQWLRKVDAHKALYISESNIFINVLGVVSTLLLTIVLYYLLTSYTDSDLPMLDAFTTAMSIVAQFLLARKKIENWIYWTIANCVYVGLYIYKGLFLTAVLYFIYIFLAVYGYYEWKRLMKIKN